MASIVGFLLIASSSFAQQSLFRQLQIQDANSPTKVITIQTNGSLGVSYSIKLPNTPLPTISTGSYPVLTALSISGQTIQLGWLSVPKQWLLSGNSATTAYDGTSGDFVGTTDAKAFVLAARSATAQPIDFYTGNSPRMHLQKTGEAAIGLTTASSFIHIASTNTGIANSFLLDAYGSSAAQGGQFITRRGEGTATSPANSAYGDDMGGMKIRGYFNGNWIECVQLDINATSTPKTTGVAVSYDLSLDGGNGMYERFHILQNGNTGIQTTSPNTTLDVNGDLSIRDTTMPTLTGGNNNNLVVGNHSFIRVAVASVGSTITGISGGADGKVLVIYNTSNKVLTLANANSNSDSDNQILTLASGSANLVTSKSGMIQLIYDSNSSKWIVTEFLP